MPRFGLHEFSTPDYRGSLPAYDENNAFWPRVSAFAKMLHDMSWEDSGDDETQEEVATPADERTGDEVASDFETNARENVKTTEDKKMDGYKPSVDAQRASNVDMDRMKALAEGTAEKREPGKWPDFRSPTKQKADDIAETFPNANMDDIAAFFPEQFTETQASKDAMKQYLDKMKWENDMQGYRPLPTR